MYSSMSSSYTSSFASREGLPPSQPWIIVKRKLLPVASNSTDISGMSGSPYYEYSFELTFLGLGTASESGLPLSLEEIWSMMRESALD